MRRWLGLSTSVCMLGVAGFGAGALAAAGEDPDWPCVQRLVPEIAPAAIWAGPPLDSVDGAASPPSSTNSRSSLRRAGCRSRTPRQQVEKFAADAER